MAAKSEFTVDGAPSYSTAGPWRWIISHMRRYPLLLAGGVLGKGLSLVAYSLAPVFIGLAANEILNGGDRLPFYALMVLLMLAGDGVINLAGAFAIENIAQRMEADAREELYRGLLSKSQTFHDRQRVGDIMARATDDVRQLNVMVNPGFVFLFETVLAFGVPVALIAALDLRLLLVPVVYIGVYVLLIRAYNNRLNPVSTSQRNQLGVLNAGLEETISGIETVKATAAEAYERKRFYHNAREFRRYFVAQGRIEAGYKPLLAYGVAVGLVFLHALFLYSREQIDIPQIITLMGLMRVIEFPTFISLFSFSLVQLGVASAERILSVIQQTTDLDQNVDGHQAEINGAVVFEGVSFGYEGGDFGVTDVSFSLQPGETVAIVGQTGSGKSTLVELVNRTYDVDSGRVLIDGIDVRDWNLQSLRSQISKIEQDVFLFSRSIADNIAFGRPDATRDEIEGAAKEAQAHDFIMGFAEGYDTVIGERGATLSGGQRQRLALARAFLSGPRILILDDSTSAIDSKTEDEIQKAIGRARQGRTTLLITHRLSQIRWADTILVMEHGTVVAKGRHDDLLRTSLPYRRMFSHYDIELPPLEEAGAPAAR